ncbi:MAG: methionyl-tRNA formyltransferase [Clostridiales bacterium]|nr:methionyl-tRNA formyltransferase [Lachnospiraceae bacterium]MDD6617161.1 methionyl-tRNA formyltransferase [Clostridiales bacterium]MDY4770210.1 methionyl-tRNA formyltransferase [Lachnospiraceae bacterium]
MKIVFMGTPDFAVGTLHALAESEHEILAVVTQPDKPKGRGKALQPTPVKEEALRYGIPVYQPKKVREEEFQAVLRELNPDLIVVVAFGQLIPKSILELPRYGCVNVHASLLPKYRGAAPIQWAVIDGEKESGVTIMKMDEGLDTGDMIAKAVVPLAADETGGSLFDKLSQIGAQLLIDTIPALEAGTAVCEKQPQESPTPYAAMLNKKMGLIDWNQDASVIECLIRGLNPWPSAYTYLKGKTLKIWQAKVVERQQEAEPGTVICVDKKQLVVACKTNALSIQRLQLEGKKQMETEAFLRGYTIDSGIQFRMNRE